MWPQPIGTPKTVGALLADLMKARGWNGASSWVKRADGIGPTLVGGSKRHGGPDLGPTRAREAWAKLGVDGRGIANEAPGPEEAVDYTPRLTTRMGARLQGFPDSWQFVGGKTSTWRQIGNAFPATVAKAVGLAIADAILGKSEQRLHDQMSIDLVRHA